MGHRRASEALRNSNGPQHWCRTLAGCKGFWSNAALSQGSGSGLWGSRRCVSAAIQVCCSHSIGWAWSRWAVCRLWASPYQVQAEGWYSLASSTWHHLILCWTWKAQRTLKRVCLRVQYIQQSCPIPFLDPLWWREIKRSLKIAKSLPVVFIIVL